MLNSIAFSQRWYIWKLRYFLSDGLEGLCETIDIWLWTEKIWVRHVGGGESGESGERGVVLFTCDVGRGEPRAVFSNLGNILLFAFESPKGSWTSTSSHPKKTLYTPSRLQSRCC